MQNLTLLNRIDNNWKIIPRQWNDNLEKVVQFKKRLMMINLSIKIEIKLREKIDLSNTMLHLLAVRVQHSKYFCRKLIFKVLNEGIKSNDAPKALNGIFRFNDWIINLGMRSDIRWHSGKTYIATNGYFYAHYFNVQQASNI